MSRLGKVGEARAGKHVPPNGITTRPARRLYEWRLDREVIGDEFLHCSILLPELNNVTV
jgi:hypothetical protein